MRTLEQNFPEGAAAFGFTRSLNFQTVIGLLVPIATQTEQAQFDLSLPQLAKTFAALFQADANQQTLRGLDDIGKARAGITAVGKVGGVSLRWDIVAFRRGKAAAILIVAYPDGDKPAVPVGDLARVLDKRVSSFLASTTKVTIWHDYGQGSSEEAALNQIVDAYRKANPDVTLYVFQVSYDQIFTKWETAVMAGGGPDMFTAPNDNLGREARAGLIRDITNVMKGKLDGVAPFAIDGLTMDGRLYGVPMLPKALALYYNKSTIPKPPATTDELMALVKSGKNLVLNAGVYYNFGWFRAFGNVPWNAKGECVNTLAIADAYHYLADLSIADSNIFQTDSAKQASMFQHFQADMTVDGPWKLEDYKKALGNKLGVVPMPAGPKGKAGPLTGIDGWYLNPNSKNVDAAIELALYITNKDNQTIYADVAGDPPARMDVSVRDPLVKVFAQAAADGYARPQAAWFDNFWNPFGDSLQRILGITLSSPRAAVAACTNMNQANLLFDVIVPIPAE